MTIQFQPLQVAVLTVSDTRTLDTDQGGPLVRSHLEEAGHQVVDRALVKDDEEAIRSAVSGWVDRPEVSVVVTTGGTGITARDVTPDALTPLITKPIPGFGELFRMLSYAEIGASTIQSRAAAGLCGGTLPFILPGSRGAVELAMGQIVIPQLDSRTRPCNFVELMPRF